jgi:inorganic pyrophosphatase
MPVSENDPEQRKRVDIVATYGREEAYEVITRSLEDYKNHFESLEEILRHV